MKKLLFTIFLFFLLLQTGLFFYYKFLHEREIKFLQASLAHRALEIQSELEERIFTLNSVSAFIESVGFDANSKEINKFMQLQHESVDNISSMIIAPEGIVKYVYPLEGNQSVLEKSYFNTPALADPRVVRQTLSARTIYVEGPRKLLQGGYALVARKAIYRNDDFLGIIATSVSVRDILDQYTADNPKLSIINNDAGVLAGMENLAEGKPVYNKKFSVLNQEWILEGQLTAESRQLIYRNLLTLEAFALLLSALILYIHWNQLRFNRRLTELVDDRTSQLQISEQKYEQLAFSDSLTGISNRLHFMNELSRLLESDDPPESLAIMYMDLNLFNRINESLGHHYGDQILTEVVARLRICKLDYHLFARAGGDDFYFMFLNNDREELIAKANQILYEISIPYQDANVTIQTNASIGISIYPEHSNNQVDLLRYADLAMQVARQEECGYCLFGHKLRKELESSEQLRTELKAAIELEQFIIYYQPQLDSRTNEFIGLEALLRWNHPREGLVGPAYFMAAAEEAGLMIEITDMVLELVCKQIRLWRLEHSEVKRVSVNIPSSWFYKRGLMESFARQLSTYQINPHDIELEITEGLILKSEYAKTIQLFRLKGVTISIDDFGTMYSSLNYLKKFPVDKLKIDKSFVQGIGKSVVDETIIKAIIYLANELNYKVIAEGVETEQQLAFLNEHTCHLIQGYYYYKPMPLLEVEQLVYPKDKLG